MTRNHFLPPLSIFKAQGEYQLHSECGHDFFEYPFQFRSSGRYESAYQHVDQSSPDRNNETSRVPLFPRVFHSESFNVGLHYEVCEGDEKEDLLDPENLVEPLDHTISQMFVSRYAYENNVEPRNDQDKKNNGKAHCVEENIKFQGVT